MKKLLFLVVFSLSTTIQIFAQVQIARNGHVSFLSDAALEKIEGHNNKVASTLNTATGAFSFKMNIKAFEFKQALLQEHFNENYMESSKYPYSTFKGQVTDLSKVNFSKDGTYNVSVKGDLTIHNVTKNVTVPGQIIVKNGNAQAKTVFNVAVADYGIEIPALVKDKIAKEVKITVDTQYEPKK